MKFKPEWRISSQEVSSKRRREKLVAKVQGTREGMGFTVFVVVCF